MSVLRKLLADSADDMAHRLVQNYADDATRAASHAKRAIDIVDRSRANNTLMMNVSGKHIPIRDLAQGSIPDGWWTKYDSFVRESDDDVFTALAKKYGNADDMIDDLRGAGNRFTDQTGISGRHAVDIASQANLDKRYYDNIRDKFAQMGEFDIPSEVLDDIASRIKPYDGKITDLYHGTSDDVADAILRDGYIPGSLLPEGAYRGGGYGQMQASTSFATDPKAASVFATAQNPQGTILQAKLNPRANIVTMDGIEYAEDLNDYIQDLRKRGIDGVWLGGDESELVSLNPNMIQNTGKRASIRGVDIKNTDFSQLFR